MDFVDFALVIGVKQLEDVLQPFLLLFLREEEHAVLYEVVEGQFVVSAHQAGVCYPAQHRIQRRIALVVAVLEELLLQLFCIHYTRVMFIKFLE